MKQIEDVPRYELAYHLRRLQLIAREVAYAKSEADMEFYTMQFLRPELEKLEQVIGLTTNETSNSN